VRRLITETRDFLLLIPAAVIVLVFCLYVAAYLPNKGRDV